MINVQNAPDIMITTQALGSSQITFQAFEVILIP